MAAKKGSARKASARKSSARKSGAQPADEGRASSGATTPVDRPSVLGDKANEARKRAQMDEALDGNILGSDPLGPSTEHEDHEGGVTDSLARKGVRGPIAHLAEGEVEPEVDP